MPRRLLRAAQRGYTLIEVLVALLIFSLGLMALASMYARFTGVATQDQNISQMAGWSNGFWGVVQGNIAMLPTIPATPITSANVGLAPAALQPWLTRVTNGLPNGTVTIVTGVDASSGNACSTSGCSVSMTITWTQNANPNGGSAITRTQSFNYQFP